MTTATARLLDEVLGLPEDERAGLVFELLGSLTPATPAEARSEDAWLAEIERRARDALAGSPGVPWEVALAEIERRRQTRR
jgi:putative addiction module component (TIGR02574 family)